MSDRTAHPVSPISKNIIFSGRVQGVGFRFTAQRFAVDLGLTGWVQNWPTGDVALYAEGDPQKISDLVQQLQTHFSIQDMKASEGPASGEYDTFDVRY
jgi:acylphosphatase